MSYNSLFGFGSHSPDADLNIWTPLGNRGGQEIASGLSAMTLTSITVDDADIPADWIDGVSVLNGTSSQFSTGDWGLYSPSTSYTYMIWAKPATASEAGYLWSNAQDGTSKGQGIYLNGAGGATTLTSGTIVSGGVSNLTQPTDSWQHICFTQNPITGDGLATGYVDGVPVNVPAAASTAPSTVAAGYWRIGNRHNGSSEAVYFAGKLCEYVRFNRVLSASEVAEAYAGPEPLNLTLPTLSIDAAGFYSGTVGTWDNQSNGTMSYDYEIRRVSDDVPVASESGIATPTFGGQVAGFTNDPAGYYVWVRGINAGGFDTAEDTTSYLGTLGDGLLHWYDASLYGTADDRAGTADATMQGSMTVVAESTGPGNGLQAFRSDAATDVAVAVPADIVRPVTMTGWVMVEDQRDSVPLEIVDTDLVDNYARIYLRNTNTTRLLVNHGGGNGIINGSQYTSGQWGFYAFSLPVPAGSTPVLFQDGATYTGSFTRTVDNFNEINFGATTNGYTDSVRVYDRELTTEELTTLYKAGRGYDHNADKPPVGPPPVTPSRTFHPLQQG